MINNRIETPGYVIDLSDFVKPAHDHTGTQPPVIDGTLAES
jgi:hypothetical protein